MTPNDAEGQGKSESGGLPDGLRAAVERTLSATGDAAAETAERAQDLLDEVARRGQEAREGLSRIRLASADEVGELNERLAGLEARIGEIEVALRASVEAVPTVPKPKVEG
jgi:hypothetical protein